MECRRSVAQLTSGEKDDFVVAVLALKQAPSLIPAAQTAISAVGGKPNRYDDYVWMHNVLGGGGHRGSAFGPWHREFLRQFELDLRKVSGTPHVSVPYWDWTVDRTPTSPGWPFTDDLLGGFGTPNGSHAVTTGRFSDPGTAASHGPWRVYLSRVQVTGNPATFIDLGPGLKRSDGMLSPASLPLRANVLTGLGILAYDQLPWNDPPPPPQMAAALVDASFRKYLERRLHDGIHVWIGYQTPPPGPGVVPTDGGHMSFPPVAVNDPVFWLHHANVDRLWTVWQQRNPTLGYQPAAGANLGHNEQDTMARFGDAAHFSFPVATRPADVLKGHDRGVWYRSDLPEIHLVAPSVNFGEVPEGLTTFRPVQFEVRTCQRVKFRVTAVGGTSFSVPPSQGTVVVEHSDALDTVVGNVHLAFQSAAPLGAPAAGTATIEASIDDADGYFAPAVNGEFVIGSWTVNMTATPVPRPSSAIALVLDRSGSMSGSAGAAGTRYDLLRSSLQVTADLMRPDDAIGIVAYDSGTIPPFGLSDGVTTLAPITAMGPAPAGAGRTAVASAIGSPDLAPRGATAIGQGMIQGAGVLDAERTNPASPYARFAMVVMTDGNENVLPYVTDPSVATAVAGFADSVYAIGLGSESGVSASTLGAIARYMLITGDITTAERRFRLTKYFVQILARVTGTSIVTDPQGDLHLGVTHEIPFLLTEGDVAVDVIALSPAAPLLDLRLVAPDGTVLTPATASPNIAFVPGREVAYYRLGLPALPGVAGTHGGEWRAVLRVSRRGGLSLAARLPDSGEVAKVLSRTGTLPYSLIVQSYSNIALDAGVEPGVARPGESLSLLATLREYDVVVEGRAQVVVEVLEPSGTVVQVPLAETAGGLFQGRYPTRVRGVHTCRFRAAGTTLGGGRFQREETRTVAVLNDIDPGVLRACLRAYADRERVSREDVT